MTKKKYPEWMVRKNNVSIRMSDSEKKSVEEFALKNGMTISQFIRVALKKAMLPLE